jgi:hypothetical protein
MKANLDGSNATALVQTNGELFGLAVDGTNAYFERVYYAVPYVTAVPLTGGIANILAPNWNATCQVNTMVVDAAKVYWTCANGQVMSLGLGGGMPVALAQSGYGYGIAVDATSVYWASQYPTGAIVSLQKSSTTPVALVPGTAQPQGIAIDSSYIYWTSYVQSGSVMKAPLAGGPTVVIASVQGYPSAIAVDANSVYWTTVGDGTIMKATPK